MKGSSRSLQKIESDDLRRLLELSKKDVDSFFIRNSVYVEDYKDKESIIVLAQGAALHYIDGKNGVKDFDVWFFYPEAKSQLPYRRRGKVDFGVSKFGVHPDDHGFKGRRIDVLMRSDSYFKYEDPAKCLEKYLRYKRSKTAILLSQKAIVGLWPKNLFGKVIWPSNIF